jgi:hypothetical protein
MMRCCNLYMDNLTTLFQLHKLYIVERCECRSELVSFNVLSVLLVLAALNRRRSGIG